MFHANDYLPRPRLSWLLALAVAASAAGCAGGAAERTKKMLTKHGTIDAEWEVRNDAKKQTHTYVLLRTKSATYETYELTATDGQAAVTQEQVGGIDGTGCYLLEYGLGSAWMLQQAPEKLEGSQKSGDKTRTKCLEYQDSAAWNFVPQKDRKAAEPPPPPPAQPGPDAGTAADGGSVKSAMP